MMAVLASSLLHFLKSDLNLFLLMTAALGIMMRGEKRRRHFALRLSAAYLVGLAFCMHIGLVWNEAVGLARIGCAVSKYSFLLLLFFLGVLLCYAVAVGSALLDVACAFCIEHITQRSKSLILLALPLDEAGELVLLYALSLGMLLGYVQLFERRVHRQGGAGRRVAPLQILVSAAVVCTDIVYSLSFNNLAVIYDAEVMLPFSYIASILFSLLVLVISRCHITATQKAYELEIVQRMLHDEKLQYQREQNAIDALNIKAHDLKHRLLALDSHLSAQERAELHQTIAAYDMSPHTGNPALDVVLTYKSLACQGQGILLSAMVDGSCLSFKQDSDIYSLFGNIIDNAMDAMVHVQDADKRFIGLTAAASRGLVSIHAENYHANRLTFVDGLPLTTHHDVYHHGFGMKSIRMLVERYGGHMQINASEEVFYLDILLPSDGSAKPLTE